MTPDIFGFTPGSILISCVVAAFGSLGFVTWWVRGMADRRRADTEGSVAMAGIELTAMETLLKSLQAEVTRLGSVVKSQDARLKSQADRIAELERKLMVAEGENVRLRAVNDAQGEIRQRAAQVVAADRAEPRPARTRRA